MDRNDYDIDYDLSAEENIDPDQFPVDAGDDDLDIESLKRLLGEEPGGDTYDMDEDTQEQLPPQEDLYRDAFVDMDLDDPTAEVQAESLPFEKENDEDMPYYGDDYDQEVRPQEEDFADEYAEEAYGEEEYAQEELDNETYSDDGYSEQYASNIEGQENYSEEAYAEEDYSDEAYAQEDYDPEAYTDEEYPEEVYAEDVTEEKAPKAKKPKKEKKPRKPIQIKKPSMPPFFMNFMAMYFGAAIAEFTGMNKEQEGRRKRSKSRIFKDAYLPVIILVLTIVLVLSCVIGAASTLVQRKRVDDEEARKESIAASEEEQRLEGEYVQLMDMAEQAALGYDYEWAVEILDTYSGEPPQEMVTKRAEYVTLSTKMTEWKDPTGIPNLSFHCLVADPARAYADKNLGGKYNMNFVTTDEFQRILESLYANNYVLVDFDSFIESSQGLDGSETFSIKPILLPENKKPVMLTETLVSYYDYMIDGNKDGTPDAGGAGFASRLVVDDYGEIKAEMVDKDGNTIVGDFDLVPILETFLKQHPDFSYRGSRAILAPTGEQGIFGYRIQTSVMSDPKLGKEYYNQQVQGAKEVVAALRAKGYTMASYTYGNKSYGQNNANQISEDLNNWDTQITPVIGDTNIMVFAQGSDIGDYTGTKYKALYEKGFRFFIGQADKPFADVANTYVRQKRLMVTGSSMFWNGKMYSGMFETAAVLNSMRGDVPKAK